MDKDYIEVKIPILDSVDEMKVVKTFTQEQLWFVCAIAKAFEKSEQQVKKQQEVINDVIEYVENRIVEDDYMLKVDTDMVQKELLDILKEVSE